MVGLRSLSPAGFRSFAHTYNSNFQCCNISIAREEMKEVMSLISAPRSAHEDTKQGSLVVGVGRAARSVFYVKVHLRRYIRTPAEGIWGLYNPFYRIARADVVTRHPF